MTTHVYWGCTTYGCERGQTGGGVESRSEDMPRAWSYCPECGGDLAEITCTCAREHPKP